MAKCNVGFANIEVHTKSGAKNKKQMTFGGNQ